MLTAERITDAALAAIDENGIESLSLRDVTDRLGVTPPAIYDHFPGKGALLAATAERVCADLCSQLRAQRGSDRERVVGGFRAYVAYARRHPHRYALMLRYPPPESAAAEACGVGPEPLKAIDPNLSPLVAWSMAHGLATLFVNTKIDDAEADTLVEQAVAVVFGDNGAGD